MTIFAQLANSGYLLRCAGLSAPEPEYTKGAPLGRPSSRRMRRPVKPSEPLGRNLVAEAHFVFPSFVVEAQVVVHCLQELLNRWQVCSTGSPELVHLQEILCRNAVVRTASNA
jgi:hypothetical protein